MLSHHGRASVTGAVWPAAPAAKTNTLSPAPGLAALAVSNRTKTWAPAEAVAPVKQENRDPTCRVSLGEDRGGGGLLVSSVAPGTERKESDGELFRAKPDKMRKASECYVNVKTTHKHFYKKSFSKVD